MLTRLETPRAGRLATLALALLLAACGGGDDASSFAGTVAVGAGVAGASVTVKQVNGVQHALVSDAEGRFAGEWRQATPAMIQCRGGSAAGQPNGLVLHAFVADGATLNCTPLTELLVWRRFGMVPAQAFARFDAALATGAADSTSAEASVLNALAELAGAYLDTDRTPRDWATRTLRAGDAADDHDVALHAVAEVLEGRQAALDMLGELIVAPN